ncbi:MAG: ferrochelatase [Planctomycetes bacterium]|nr:ferrochelatase [Planctomycetota bacterium]
MTEASADSPAENYDAVLVVSFGGPEGPDDVIPFLENVLRGKNVPRERMMEVAGHYQHFGGVSPINDQCRDLIAALKTELAEHDIDLPVYWGNRNWHPMLADTLREMKDAGVKRALAFVTAAYSSYSSCRQYREDIENAQAAVGEGAPDVDKIRVFYNHPDFIAVTAANLAASLEKISDARRDCCRVAFTAHSIPNSMADSCDYVKQMTEASRLTAEENGISADRWQLVYQSRSGPPQVPWLEPDIVDHLKQLHESGTQDVIVMPIGFLSDHMEVLFDLDEEAKQACEERGLNMIRAATVGSDPRFISMIRKLIQERTAEARRESLGDLGPSHDVCPLDCCPKPQRPRKSRFNVNPD